MAGRVSFDPQCAAIGLGVAGIDAQVQLHLMKLDRIPEDGLKVIWDHIRGTPNVVQSRPGKTDTMDGVYCKKMTSNVGNRSEGSHETKPNTA